MFFDVGEYDVKKLPPLSPEAAAKPYAKYYYEGRTELEDKLMRSYGIFTQARLMTTKEFMTRLSNVRLAADLGFVSVAPETLDRLQRDVQPATLERNAGRKLSQGERDELRAEIIRKALT